MKSLLSLSVLLLAACASNPAPSSLKVVSPPATASARP
jgi:hypothetical protein